MRERARARKREREKEGEKAATGKKQEGFVACRLDVKTHFAGKKRKEQPFFPSLSLLLSLCSFFLSQQPLSSPHVRHDHAMGALAAVVLTVVSSGGSAVGKAMQKQGTRSLPRLRLDAAVLQRYVRCRPWVAGISLDVAGALLMVAAVAQAPVREWRRERDRRERRR